MDGVLRSTGFRSMVCSGRMTAEFRFLNGLFLLYGRVSAVLIYGAALSLFEDHAAEGAMAAMPEPVAAG